MKTKRPVNYHHKLRLAALLVTCSALAACTHTSQEVTGSIPADYRLRHPIVIQEANQTVDIFVGNARGGLSAAQRADIAGLASAWLREGTGIIYIDVPVSTPNARASADSLREIKSLLVTSGIPSNGFSVRNYRTADPQQFATIRLHYPRIKADAGPCGLWPEDIGPSIKNKSYLENESYWNFGCASQRNLAAIVENPSDLVQPRTETPIYTARRNTILDKYRKGESTASTANDADKAKITSVGQ